MSNYLRGEYTFSINVSDDKTSTEWYSDLIHNQAHFQKPIQGWVKVWGNSALLVLSGILPILEGESPHKIIPSGNLSYDFGWTVLYLTCVTLCSKLH